MVLFLFEKYSAWFFFLLQGLAGLQDFVAPIGESGRKSDGSRRLVGRFTSFLMQILVPQRFWGDWEPPGRLGRPCGSSAVL